MLLWHIWHIYAGIYGIYMLLLICHEHVNFLKCICQICHEHVNFLECICRFFFWTEITEHKVGIELTQHILFHWKFRETWTEQNSFHNNTFHPIQDTDLKVPFDDTDIQVANTHTHLPFTSTYRQAQHQ